MAILASRSGQKKGKMVHFRFARTAKRGNIYDVLLANHNTTPALSKTVVYLGKALKFYIFLAVLSSPL